MSHIIIHQPEASNCLLSYFQLYFSFGTDSHDVPSDPIRNRIFFIIILDRFIQRWCENLLQRWEGGSETQHHFTMEINGDILIIVLHSFNVMDPSFAMLTAAK